MRDKRRYPRYRTRAVIRCKKLDDPVSGWHEQPEIKNISMGGMLFSAYEKFLPKTILLFNIQIYTKETLVRIIELRGEVVSVEEDMTAYDTHIKWIDLHKETRSLLRGFIDFLSLD